ncbi:hypothetical protein QN367_18290 [Cryobacterium sp. RTS3]|uniref:hypothetical protein n=1 Tax=Cryobacterium sp. RTS3 TaxID=3048643 RepID=UPI002B225A18|nr:hypothetical protein [Cryobacterium sp. RTS3]MEB0001020.1 hypothetical protein [Cryobacterium sp. RTS3]
MKSQAITILSIVGVLGTGVAAMAVNSDVLSSSVQAPIGQSSEALLVTPSADPATPVQPDPAATGIAVPTDLPAAGGSDDTGAVSGSDDGSTQPSPGSTGAGTRSEPGAASGAGKSTGGDDAPRPVPVPVAPAPAPAPVPAAPVVTPAPTKAPHVEDSGSDDSKTPSTGEKIEKDD